MLPAITASPHLATPSLAYCRAQTSSSPRLSRSLVHACPRRKNSNQNAWACEFNYLIDFWRFGLEGKMGLMVVEGRKCLTRLARCAFFHQRDLSSWERFLAQHRWSLRVVTERLSALVVTKLG